MNPRHLWYIKRGDLVEGPFPVRLMTRWRLLGRVGDDTLVSPDRIQWQPAAELPELLPEELRRDLSDPGAQQRLLAAIRWEDDRAGKDRRTGSAQSLLSEYPRATRDRRHGENLEQLTYRQVRTHRDEVAAQQREHEELLDASRRRGQLIWLVGLVVAISAAAVVFIPRPVPEVPPDCGAPAREAVNWNYCQMQGAQLPRAALRAAQAQNVNLMGAILAGADLRQSNLAYAQLSQADLGGAQLQGASLVGASLRRASLKAADLAGANLAYADFSGADVDGARLEGAVLDKAVWIDGRVCGNGSLGVCR